MVRVNPRAGVQVFVRGRHRVRGEAEYGFERCHRVEAPVEAEHVLELGQTGREATRIHDNILTHS